ncbi:endonuclease III [Spirochaetia bacterium]|nr:endonuclease III [Spirochaetia bacterium]
MFNWDGLFAALEAWRNAENAIAGTEPSVTTVAERYRHDPWAVLVSTILSLRTKDEVTLVASTKFLAKAPNPAALRGLSVEETEKIVFPAGFYHTKAASLKKIAEILGTDYGDKVPSDLDTLLTLPGVGRKTANLVLIEAFDMDGVCVDTHVHRICNRLGLLTTQTPNETELILRKIMPRRYWKTINALLVLYGQRLCRPISPFCSRCTAAQFCKKVGVGKAR